MVIILKPSALIQKLVVFQHVLAGLCLWVSPLPIWLICLLSGGILSSYCAWAPTPYRLLIQEDQERWGLVDADGQLQSALLTTRSYWIWIFGVLHFQLLESRQSCVLLVAKDSMILESYCQFRQYLWSLSL